MKNIELKIENDYLSIVCLPQHGGKISSIYSQKQNFELLFQNPKKKWSKAYPDANFEDFEACGFDDAFPSIDREQFYFNNKTYCYPDHGEVWSTPMDYIIEDDNIYLTFQSSILSYKYYKHISIQKNKLHLSYKIVNTGNEDFPAFWTMHGLFNIEDDMQIFLPKGTKNIQNVMNAYNSPLGSINKIYKYPTDNNYDFTKVVNTQDINTCSKFYIADPIEDGNCGYIYPKRNLKININFDNKALPYLGFWKTLGPFRGDKNCALEPSSGFYDNIKTAIKNHKCPILKANKTFTFKLSIEIDKIK